MRYKRSDWVNGDEIISATDLYVENWDKYRKHGLGLGFHYKRQGSGKTFLATYVARALIRKGEAVQYKNFRDFINIGNIPLDKRQEEEDRLREASVLVLDDIVAPWTDPQQNLWGSIFEGLIRYRTDYEKVTIFTTNLEPDELDDYYPRTYSLLAAREKQMEVPAQFDYRREGMLELEEYLANNDEMRPIC